MKKLRRVLSTVKTIHKDKIADMLRGWLFSDNYTLLCQQSRQSIRTTQQPCWGDDCSVTTTQGSVNSQDNPWRHNTADMLIAWLFSNNNTRFCQQSRQSMKTQHSKHVNWMIVHWQLHAAVSTVKTIHEDNTADMLTGWLFSNNTGFCQQSRQSMRTTQQTCWLDGCSVTQVLSTVKAIHEDTTQQTCRLDDCSLTATRSCVNSQDNPWGQHSRHVDWMIVQWQLHRVLSTVNLFTVNAHTTNQFCNNTHKQMGNNTHDQAIW